MKRLIIFLIRWRLRIKKYERFKFKNQKSNDIYWFATNGLYKTTDYGGYIHVVKSGVSLNWLLDRDCEIERVPMKRDAHE